MNDVLTQRLARKAVLVLDGGLATQLEATGEQMHETLWSASLLRDRPEAIRAAHRAYLDAGSELLITASYQASREGFRSLGITDEQADALLARSVTLAREAAQEAGKPETLIAASVGPWGATQHDGSEYTGHYDIDRTALRRFHRERLRALAAGEPDLFACETIPNELEAEVLAEVLAADLAADLTGESSDRTIPAWVSFCCRDDQSLSDGTPIEQAARAFRDHPRVRALGINCTGPQHVPTLLRRLRQAVPGMPLIVYPNSGERYDADQQCWHGTASPDEVAAAARRWHEAGAQAIGGCCRIGPDHIAALRTALRTNPREHNPHE